MFKKILSASILIYFRALAKIQLKKNRRALVIGVTGSAGKTSARLAIVKILREKGKVKHSHHANSESGIPLNILGISPRTYTKLDWLRMILQAPIMLLLNWEKYDYYVVEMGIDSPNFPKNMSYLLSIVKPDVGVVLNASLTHASEFDYLVKDSNHSRRMKKLILEIAKEKMKLARGIHSHGVAIYNLDQAEFARERNRLTSRQITFGKSTKSSLRILKVENTINFSMQFSYQGQLYHLTTKDILPTPYAYTFAAAIATAASLGISPTISIKALSEYRLPPGRSRLLMGIKDSLLIDSSYNASPSTMLESLKLLSQLGKKKSKIAVIGDMRELGNSEKQIHKTLADWLVQYCDKAILFGPLTAAHTLPVLQAKKFPVQHFDSMSDLRLYLKANIKPKSVILFKGSQNTILLERAVEHVLADPHDASLLCRRGSYWDKIRSSTL